MFQTTNLHLIWNQTAQQQREAARTVVVVVVVVRDLARNFLSLLTECLCCLPEMGPSFSSLNQNSPSLFH